MLWRVNENTAENRYVLQVRGATDPSVTMTVRDLKRSKVLLRWHGATAKRLLRSETLRRRVTGNGLYAVSKAELKRLTLTATALDLAGDGGTTIRARRPLPGLHAWVSACIAERAGHHPALDDVICGLLCRFPALDPHQVESCLADLVRWRVIQRIVVDEDNVFFDADPRPHLHVFDPLTRELRDAPRNGVVCVKPLQSLQPCVDSATLSA